MALNQRNAYFKSEFKTREEVGEKFIEGYFIVYDQRTELWENYFEEISLKACDESVNKNDIRALYNHCSDMVLGRKSAKTLTLKCDDYGVYGSIIVNQADTEAMNVYERVKRGDINGCSFGFYATEEERQKENDGIIVMQVKKADVLEISVCPFPAYPQTSIQARKKENEQHKVIQLSERKKEIRRKLNVSST